MKTTELDEPKISLNDISFKKILVASKMARNIGKWGSFMSQIAEKVCRLAFERRNKTQELKNNLIWQEMSSKFRSLLDHYPIAVAYV